MKHFEIKLWHILLASAFILNSFLCVSIGGLMKREAAFDAAYSRIFMELRDGVKDGIPFILTRPNNEQIKFDLKVVPRRDMAVNMSVRDNK